MTIRGKKAKKRLFIESFVFVLIAISPFVFKLHEFVSSDPEAIIKIFGFTIDRNGFSDISTYAWFLLGKFVPLYLLLLWFLTCKHWWYHITIIPLTMYAFQIFEVLYSEDEFVDTENVIWLLPVCMVVVPFVYFIRIKLYDKHVHGIDLEAMEAELNTLKEKQGVQRKEMKVKATLSSPSENNNDYLSLSEKIDQKLSTNNLESIFRQFQNQLNNWLNLRF